MKFIDKSTPNSLDAARKLHGWRDSYRYGKQDFPQYQGLELSELCQKSDINGSYLFKIIPSKKKNNLRESLRKEQSALCCYCCQKLDVDKFESKEKELNEKLNFEPIEHFLDKGTHPCKAFNYENLLLSCRGNKQFKRYHFTRNDSKENIATQFQITVADLESENPNSSSWSFNHEDQIEIKLPQHCDVAKEYKPIVVNPADSNQKDCWKRFVYNENGEILPKEGDKDAEKAIEVLKLNVTILKEGRKVAWKEAQNSYMEANITELLEIGSEISDYSAYKRVLQILKESVSSAPFSPVYWYYFENR